MPTPEPIKTARLVIRPFTPADAPAVARFASAFEVADMTLTIPHPYSLDDAHKFMALAAAGYESGAAYPMAITLRETAELIGAIGLHLDKPHNRAELGYWIAVPHWTNGYATEASRAMLPFGFTILSLTKITAHHFARNPASGRILEKIGMQREGTFRRHIKKWDGYEDIIAYGILNNTRPA